MGKFYAHAVSDLPAEHIYTFRLDGDSVRFTVFTHDEESVYRPKIGEGYTLQPGMLQVFKSGLPHVRDLYTDENGQWISAYAPIRDSQGNVVGLLEVDEQAEAYFAAYRALTRWTIALALLALA